MKIKNQSENRIYKNKKDLKPNLVKMGWVCCPFCNKKQFPAGNAVVKELVMMCRKCKNEFVVIIEYVI